MQEDGNARTYDGGLDMAADAFIGAVAGGGAVWLMDRVDWFMFNREDPQTRAWTEEARPRGMDPAHLMADTTAKAAGRDLQPAQPNLPGVAMHYSLGIGPGAVYSVLNERVPVMGAGRGALYGLGLFLIQDEALNSMIGFAGRPRDYPWQDHARGLIAHVVYGMAMDAGVRSLKRATRPQA